MPSSKQRPDFPGEEEARQAKGDEGSKGDPVRAADTAGRFSTSVKEVAKRLSDSGRVTPGAMVAALLKLHPKYGGGVADELVSAVEQATGEQKPVEKWLDEVYSP